MFILSVVVLSTNKPSSFTFGKPKFLSVLPRESHVVQVHLCRRASTCHSTTDSCYIFGQILQAKSAQDLLRIRVSGVL